MSLNHKQLHENEHIQKIFLEVVQNCLEKVWIKAWLYPFPMWGSQNCP